MSEQPTTKSATGPILCKMGCGFFGSEATGSCCSKCYLASFKSASTTAEMRPAVTPQRHHQPQQQQQHESDDADPMDVCQESIRSEDVAPKAQQQPTVAVAAVAPTSSTAPKKKKKKGYKNLMATMMTQQDANKAENERHLLTQGLGGGAFSKIEKI